MFHIIIAVVDNDSHHHKGAMGFPYYMGAPEKAKEQMEVLLETRDSLDHYTRGAVPPVPV